MLVTGVAALQHTVHHDYVSLYKQWLPISFPCAQVDLLVWPDHLLSRLLLLPQVPVESPKHALLLHPC